MVTDGTNWLCVPREKPFFPKRNQVILLPKPYKMKITHDGSHLVFSACLNLLKTRWHEKKKKHVKAQNVYITSIPSPFSYLSSSLSTSVLSAVPLFDLRLLLRPLPLFLPSFSSSLLFIIPHRFASSHLRPHPTSCAVSMLSPGVYKVILHAVQKRSVCRLTNFSFLLLIHKLCLKSLCQM